MVEGTCCSGKLYDIPHGKSLLHVLECNLHIAATPIKVSRIIHVSYTRRPTFGPCQIGESKSILLLTANPSVGVITVLSSWQLSTTKGGGISVSCHAAKQLLPPPRRSIPEDHSHVLGAAINRHQSSISSQLSRHGKEC